MHAALTAASVTLEVVEDDMACGIVTAVPSVHIQCRIE
jgi:hypothetical protein